MLNELLTKNHKYIRECAKNICRVKNDRMCDDLVSETYLRVSKFKTLPANDSEFVNVFVTNMKFMFIARGSTFNKLFNPKEIEISETYQVMDETSEDDIYLNCEQTNESTKELIAELSHLTQEKVESYVSVMEFKESLPGWEKEVFEEYFELDKSGRLIARESNSKFGYEVSRVTVHRIINVIKNKIETWQNENSLN